MLTIPSAVQTLIDSDSVPKNFRVRFPNGEQSDLTNFNILRESVRFTESICSRESFRFGLAEASVMEFETIGVPDMRGMTIQCFCEISVSSLSAAQIAAIQAGTWDGTLVKIADSDLGWPFFQIPYGTFVVSECPRNQETMTHRRVKAFSVDYFSAPNAFEALKLSAPIQWAGAKYAPFVVPLALAQLSQNDDAPILAAGYTKSTSTAYPGIGDSFTTINGLVVEATNADGDTLQLQVTAVAGGPATSGTATYGYKDLQGIHLDKAHMRAYVASIDALIESLDIDYSVPVTVDGTESVIVGSPAELRTLVGSQYQVYNGTLHTNLGENGKAWLYNSFEPFFWFSTNFGAGVDCRVTAEMMDYSTGAYGDFAIYPWGILTSAQADSVNNYGGISVPRGYELTVTNVTAGTTQTFTDKLIKTGDAGKLKFSLYAPPVSAPMLDDRLSFDPNGDELGVSSFTGCYDASKVINDYLELLAQFASPARIGATEIFRPDSSSPVAALPSDYRSFWWDEYSATAVGRVRFLLSLGSDDFIVDYVFGNGQATYDMTDNTLLRDMGYTQQDAIDFLTANLIPYISGIALDTVELEARGRPQVESGDFLAVTSEDGTRFLACITRRELRGIQVLTDDIDAIGNQLGGPRTSSAVVQVSPAPGPPSTGWTSEVLATNLIIYRQDNMRMLVANGAAVANPIYTLAEDDRPGATTSFFGLQGTTSSNRAACFFRVFDTGAITWRTFSGGTLASGDGWGQGFWTV